ncbi:hypothetical protein L227DRAFT_288659 [Lentinus tigrinus ALCF2SS1-6]|uniref:Uncharacterized protein n=1 Tax=Lentinus tigrinus ALCF2SS1-6 TaxID=1328759 RepID=A0A5C2RYQ6_9APHY|nr:hypothetical protein L227DRAFT_288659 [Lentinus tigrinus ALCF2SS1-6]
MPFLPSLLHTQLLRASLCSRATLLHPDALWVFAHSEFCLEYLGGLPFRLEAELTLIAATMLEGTGGLTAPSCVSLRIPLHIGHPRGQYRVLRFEVCKVAHWLFWCPRPRARLRREAAVSVTPRIQYRRQRETSPFASKTISSRSPRSPPYCLTRATEAWHDRRALRTQRQSVSPELLGTAPEHAAPRTIVLDPAQDDLSGHS